MALKPLADECATSEQQMKGHILIWIAAFLEMLLTIVKDRILVRMVGKRHLPWGISAYYKERGV